MKRFCMILAFLLVLGSLAACAARMEPTEVTSFTEPAREEPRVVTTVDELLAAIAPRCPDHPGRRGVPAEHRL